MSDLIQKIFLAGVGALALTKEKVESVVDDLVKRGEIARADKPDFLNEMLSAVEKGRTETREFLRREIEKTMKVLDIPTRSEIEELKKLINSRPQTKAKKTK
ncbi:MAG: phasin family protein [Candidatus Neomarinimicrobiota bacterium]